MNMKELKCRGFKFNDVYDAAKIIKKIKIDVNQDELKQFNNNSLQAGINIIKNMIANSSEAKEEINNFLGGFFNITGDEFGNLDLEQSMDAMEQLSKLKGLSRFFGLVRKLMN